MRLAIALAAKSFVHRNLLKKASPSFSLRGFYCWGRAFFAAGYDYREKLRKSALLDLKLDDAVDLFGEMVQSRPVPSIIEFNKLLSTIAKMKKFAVVISLGEQMQKLG